VEVVEHDWIEHACFNRLKILITFTEEWMDGKLAGCVGCTEPLEVDYARTLVSVRLRDWKRTLYNDIPSGVLRPIHPKGLGEMVVVIAELRRGEVLLVDVMDSDGMCSLIHPGGFEVVLECASRSLAVLDRR
jgi:hypothetical protein